jgi:hypothetical protein
MLRRISILNSKIFAKAELKLDDCDSIQLVGSNNIGKSTLIYALNFLFVFDNRNMNFSGGRKLSKETVEHYFPSSTQSYIIFEIFKHGYYCIIIKRDIDFNLEYYLLESEYKEEYFVNDLDGKIQMKKFDEVQTGFLVEGITLEEIKNKSDVFSKIYQRGKRNNAVVWLEDTVKANGLNNNFTKIYRYLINTKLIDNNTLKESLIIADNRENESLYFSGRDRNDLNKLKKLNDEIRALNEIKDDFFEFRKLVDKCNGMTSIAGKLKYSFNNTYLSSLNDLEIQIKKKDAKRIEIEADIKKLSQKGDESNQRIGKLKAQIENYEKSIREIDKLIEKINKLEPLTFIKQAIDNKEKERKELEYKLSHISNKKLSSSSIQSQISRAEKQIKQNEDLIANFDSLLIHNISDENEIKNWFNSVFNEEITNLPKKNVIRKIKSIGESLKIHDGEIKIPESLELRPLKTISDYKEEIEELKKLLKEQTDLLEVAKKLELFNEKLNGVKSEIETLKEHENLQLSLPSKEKEKKGLLLVINTSNSEITTINGELKKLKIEIERKEEALQTLTTERNRFESKKKNFVEYKAFVDTINVDEIENESIESIEQLNYRLKQNEEGEHGRIVLISSKRNQFENLKSKLNRLEANESDFIRLVSEEIACLEDKKNSITTLLQSISNQFAVPAHKLITRFDDFKKFVYNKFNTILSKTQISDIKELKIEIIDNAKLVNELKQIKAIQNFDGNSLLQFDQSENLMTLNKYLDNQKDIQFQELFDIKLKINVKGEDRFVDLKNQVESDGTDRMIRLVFMMMVINKLVINDKENKVALFIDEVTTIDKNNRPELVRFCREHNFIPIFAAPDTVPDFNKYYFIKEATNGGKIIISEKRNVMLSERD